MTPPSCTVTPRITVLQVPWFDPERPTGGAEVVAAQVVDALAAIGDVRVLHGQPEGSRTTALRTFRGRRLAALAGFPIDDHVRHDGVIRPRFTVAARALLAATDVLVSVERVLDEDAGVPQMTCLGGSGYPHCRQVLRSTRWDRLVVPSTSVLQELTPAPSQESRIEVVGNGVDTGLFAPDPAAHTHPDGHTLRLLVPSRPGWEKGHRHAIRLARALQEQGRPVELVCVRHEGFLETDVFYRQLLGEAEGLSLRLLPWQGHRRMPARYREADLTLCLSEIPEGFGLAAAESVACGTPVLAARSGFLPRMFPPGHGLHVVDLSAPSSSLAAAAAAAARGRRECLALGRPYVATNYGLARMRRAYARLVGSLLA